MPRVGKSLQVCRLETGRAAIYRPAVIETPHPWVRFCLLPTLDWLVKLGASRRKHFLFQPLDAILQSAIPRHSNQRLKFVGLKGVALEFVNAICLTVLACFLRWRFP